jgi:hypothetical protein
MFCLYVVGKVPSVFFTRTTCNLSPVKSLYLAEQDNGEFDGLILMGFSVFIQHR